MRYLLLFSLLCFQINAFAQQKTVAKKSSLTRSAKNRVLLGVASFYHNKFEGRKTANGSRYSKVKMTAACNRLPLNRWIKVTSMENHRSVIVKVTDRMSKKNKRLVDLSLAAAQKLHMTGKGLISVKIELMPVDYRR